MRSDRARPAKGALRRLLIGLYAVLLLAGCGSAPVVSTRTILVSCQLPTLTPTQESTATQTRGGVEITLIPAVFRCVPASQDTLSDATPTVAEMLRSYSLELLLEEKVNGPDHLCFFSTTSTPILRVKPKRLSFKVRIRNHLPGVIRGRDLVVLFSVGGEVQPGTEDAYAEFADATIPPQGEQEFDIFGPPVTAISSGATIGVLLHEVSANDGTAASLTEPRDFEWRFLLTTQTRQEPGTVKRTRDFHPC